MRRDFPQKSSRKILIFSRIALTDWFMRASYKYKSHNIYV